MQWMAYSVQPSPATNSDAHQPHAGLQSPGTLVALRHGNSPDLHAACTSCDNLQIVWEGKPRNTVWVTTGQLQLMHVLPGKRKSTPPPSPVPGRTGHTTNHTSITQPYSP